MDLKFSQKKYKLIIKLLSLRKAKGYYSDNIIEAKTSLSRLTFLATLIHEFVHFLFDVFIIHNLTAKQEDEVCYAIDKCSKAIFKIALNKKRKND